MSRREKIEQLKKGSFLALISVVVTLLATTQGWAAGADRDPAPRQQLDAAALPVEEGEDEDANFPFDFPFGEYLPEGDAEEGSEPEVAGEAIPGQYIVVFEPTVRQPATAARQLVGQSDVNAVYRHALTGFAGSMSAREAKRLRNDPRVKYVVPNRVVETEAQTIPTGIKRTFDLSNPYPDIDGSDDVRIDVNVAVIDTGIDYTHPDLSVAGRTNCVPKGEKTSEPSAGCVDGQGTDLNGHGSHTAGTIGALDNSIGPVGVAPGAHLWAVRVLNGGGTGTIQWIIEGIDWVTATREDEDEGNDIDVANVSIGCGIDCKSQPLKDAFTHSAEAGVVYAIAAGNDAGNASGSDFTTSPATITVSALTDYDGKPGGYGTPTCSNRGPDDTLASFSNYGKTVEVAAPGVCIYSTYKEGKYATASGTSMAAPHVAGAAALLASENHPENLEDVEAIRDAIVADGNSEWFDGSGDGEQEPLLDVGRAVTELATIDSETAVTLHGRLKPVNEKTTYWFEYGKSTAYGTSAPIPSATAAANSSYVKVAAEIKGLEPKTTYHGRLVASNKEGTFHGEDQTFGTGVPSVTIGTATDVTGNSATLNGTVKPEGLLTEYYFEYGPTAAYGRRSPDGWENAGSGVSSVSVNAVAGVLADEKTYHFRIVVRNVAGTKVSSDQTFTTGAADWPAERVEQPNPNPLPSIDTQQYNSLFTSVSCAQPDDCMAVGNFRYYAEQAEAMHWDGASWSPSQLARPTNAIETLVTADSCPATNRCFAVGYGLTVGQQGNAGLPVIQDWDGTKWRVASITPPEKAIEVPITEGMPLLDVSCASTDICVAVGLYYSEGKARPMAYEWDGESWQLASLPLPPKTSGSIVAEAVDCPSVSWCMLVGRQADSATYPFAEIWNGSKWEVAPEALNGEKYVFFNEVSCAAAGDCTVNIKPSVNSDHRDPHMVRWQTDHWTTQETLPAVPGSDYASTFGLSCTENSTCRAMGVAYVDQEYLPIAYRWDGSSWTTESVTVPRLPEETETPFAFLTSVSCTSADSCVSVGGHSPYTAEATGLAAFSQAPPIAETKAATNVRPTRASLNAEIDPAGGVTRYYFEYGSTAEYGSKTAELEAGSAASAVEVSKVLGGLEPGATYHYRVVAVNHAGKVEQVAKGDDETFATPYWEPRQSPHPEGALESSFSGEPSCTSSTWCVATGSYEISKGGSRPLAALWDGLSWGSLEVPMPSGASEAELTSVSCPTTTYCIAAGNYKNGSGVTVTLVEKWNGSSWSVQTSPNPTGATESRLTSVSCSAASTCMATGYYKNASGTWLAMAIRGLAGTWGNIAMPTPEGALETKPEGVSCTSMNSCSSSGFYKNSGGTKVPLVESWDGSKWALKSITPPEGAKASALYGVSCNSTSFCVAAGYYTTASSERRPLAAKWNGTSWAVEFPQLVEGAVESQLWGVSCVESTICEAMGWYRTSGSDHISFAERWSKAGWSLQPVPDAEGAEETYLSGIACPSAATCMATGWFEDEFGTHRTSTATYGGVSPIAATSAATNVLVTQATLNGSVNPNGESAAYYFEYGKTTSYGSSTEPIDVDEAAEAVAAPQIVKGLSASTTYHFRIVATNPSGTHRGGDQSFTTGISPTAETKAATEVGPHIATLNGKVNPRGLTTSYFFEYGKTAAYGQATDPISVGSGTTDKDAIAEVSGLDGEAVYHFRLAATNGDTTVYGADHTFETFASVPEQLTAMAVTDPLDGTTNAVSDFGQQWSALGWAEGSKPKGVVNSGGIYGKGWGPSDSYPTVNGAYFHVPVTDLGPSTGVLTKMRLGPVSENRYFSLWTDMSDAGQTHAGYELRFTLLENGGSKYNVALSKWVEGKETVLATKSAYTIPINSSLALVDQGEAVSAWVDTGEGYGKLLGASDSTFAGGTAGVGGSGNSTRLIDFRVGTLLFPAADMSAALGALPVRDAFATDEAPLSGGGAWSALAWDDSTSGNDTGRVFAGWGPKDLYPTINGAYWQPGGFADTGGGQAVAATLAVKTLSTDRYFSLWLGMPEPGSARSGYEASFKHLLFGLCEVTLTRWESGEPTELASTDTYVLAPGYELALVDKVGTVSVWSKSEDEFTELLSASDATFTAGYAGISGSGNTTRLKDFRAGTLPNF